MSKLVTVSMRLVYMPMSRIVDALLALNWLWYGFVSLLPSYKVTSSLITYVDRSGISLYYFGYFCLFIGVTKLYAVWRNKHILRASILTLDLFISLVFAGTILIVTKVPGAAVSTLIFSALIFVTLLKTALSSGTR